MCVVGREAGLGLVNECVEGREVGLGSVEGSSTLRGSSGVMSFEVVDKKSNIGVVTKLRRLSRANLSSISKVFYS